MDYSIESLAEIFEEYRKAVLMMRIESVKKFKEDYPGEELPAHFQDDFNIAQALSVMAREILELKKRVLDAEENPRG